MENANVAYTPSFVPQAEAANDTLYAYLKGNYNGAMLKVQNGSNVYVLAMPVIVAKDMSTANLKTIENMGSGNLVFPKKSNIPASYTQNGVTPPTNIPAPTFAPLSNGSSTTAGTGVLIYSNTTGTMQGDSATIANISTNLQSIYQASEIANDNSLSSAVASIINSSGSNLTNITSGIVSTSLGASISNSGSTVTIQTPSAPTILTGNGANGSVNLTWTAPTNTGSTITGYKVYWGTTSGSYSGSGIT